MNKELKRPVMQAIVAFIFIVLIKIVSILTLRKVDIVYPAVDIILSIAVIFILLRFRNEFNSQLPRSSHNFPAARSIVSGVVLLLVILTIYETFAPYSNILPYGLYHIIFFFLVLIPVYSLWKILYDHTDRISDIFGVIMNEGKKTCSCGWENPGYAKYCNVCGSPFPEM